MSMAKDDFKFDINAKRIRLSDDEVLTSVKKYAEKVNFRYFPSTEYLLKFCLDMGRERKTSKRYFII